MQSTFEQRLGSAVRAGWWTVLIMVGAVVLQWIGTAVFLARQPGWFLRMWAPDMTWARIESIVLQVLLLFRLFVGIFTMLLVWASLWSVVLKRRVAATRSVPISPPATAVAAT